MHGFTVLFPLALLSAVRGAPMFSRAAAAGTPIALVNVTTPVLAVGQNFQVLNFTVVDKNLAVEIACANDQATCLAAGTDSRLCDLNVADCENGNGLNKAKAAMNNDAADPNADPTPAGCQATSFGTFCDNIGAINVGSLKTPVSGDEATGSLFTVGNLVFPEREVALQVGCLTDEAACTAGAAACDQARVKCEQDNSIAGVSITLKRFGTALSGV